MNLIKSWQIVRLGLVAVVLGLGACGPSLGKKIALPEIPTVNAGPKLSGPSMPWVFIDEISDGRNSKIIVEDADGQSEGEGDLPKLLREAMTDALITKGINVTDEAPLVLSASVKEWNAAINPGFAAEVKSQAKLYIEIFDPANKRVYTGEYTGSSAIKHPSLARKDVQESLGVAMSEAISQIVSDEKLMKVLSAF